MAGSHRCVAPGYLNGSTTATFTQAPPASGAGALPASYIGNIFIGDAGHATYQAGISQTMSGLTAGLLYSLSEFYYSGAQQTGFSGTSQDYWTVCYGAISAIP